MSREREGIRAALFALEATGGDVAPTVSHILRLAPHLELHEAAGLLQAAREAAAGSITRFIGPPLLIRGAEHIYEILRRRDGELRLRWGRVFRRRESYLGWRPVTDSNSATVYPYRERVANYAEVTYGNALEWDHARVVVSYCLQYEKSHLRVTAGYRLPWAEMEQLSQSRCPFLQTLDSQLWVATVDPFEAAEIDHGHPSGAALNCLGCGSGFVAGFCVGCGSPLLLEAIPRDWPSCDFADAAPPLHLRLIESANIMDRFQISPMHAIKSHYAAWAADGSRPPPARVPRDRVITFRDEKHEV